MRRLVPLLAILLLAAATRIVNAGHWPVWTDEGWSAWAASDHRAEVILDKVAQDRHPPLYFLSLSAWWTLAGNSRIALRFLSIASGILAVAVVYRIGVDWFGSRAAHYAALLLSVLYVAIYYSQEIRHYGWLILSVCLMTLFFLRYLRHPRFRTLFLYTSSTAFMFYSLYIGVLVLIVQIGIGLLAWHGARRAKAYLIGAWLAAGLLYAPWLVALSRQFAILGEGIAGFPTTFDGLLSVAGIMFGGQLALTGSLYVLGAQRIVARPQPAVTWLARMTILFSGFGLLCVMAVANLWIGMLSARTLAYLAPMLMLVCGYGLSLIAGQARRILAIMLVAVALVTTDFTQPRLDYHLAAQAVAADFTPGDLIILETGWDDNAFRYELTLALPAEPEPEIIRTLPWVGNRFVVRPVVPQVEDRIRAHRRVWIVNWLQPSQVIPFLDKGGDGFTRVISRTSPIGTQYKDLYSDPLVREVLFERPETGKTEYHFGDVPGSRFTLRDALFPAQATRGQALHIDLWWSVPEAVPLDYSVGVFLLDATGAVRVQHDGPPGAQPTTQWTPNALIFDRHTLTVPGDLPPDTYRIGVQVYWYGNREPLPVNGAKYAIIGEVKVGAGA